MAQDYRVRFRCLQSGCSFHQWTVLEDVPFDLKEVYAAVWDFDCPQHGPQRGRPFQAEIKKVFPARRTSRRQAERSKTRDVTQPV